MYNIYVVNDITKVKVHILPDIPGNFTYKISRSALGIYHFAVIKIYIYHKKLLIEINK